MREIVKRGYNEGDCLSFFRLRKTFTKLENRFFKELLANIPKGGKILDLGSGPGIPYDKYLVNSGFQVTGIDISEKHVEMAQKNVPLAHYIKGDFSSLDFGDNSYDAIISLYAVFHIPREEHFDLFLKIHRTLKDDGVVLVTLGLSDTELGVDEFIGSRMAWSSYPADKNKELVKGAGFEFLKVEEEHFKEEHHLWILAKKKKK